MTEQQIPVDRRQALKISGAIAAGAITGLAGCLDDDPEDPAAPEDEDDDFEDVDDDADDVEDEEEEEETHTLTVTVVAATDPIADDDELDDDNGFDDENDDEVGEDDELGDENEENDDEFEDEDDVEDPAGEPIAGAVVTIQDESGLLGGIFPDEADEGETDQDGMVDVELTDGEYTAVAEHEEYEQGEEVVEIAGADADVTIELEPIDVDDNDIEDDVDDDMDDEADDEIDNDDEDV